MGHNSSHIGICHFKLESLHMIHKIAQLTLYLFSTLIREFFGPSPSVFLEKMFICADTLSVRLPYDVNLKLHLSICAEICRAEQKYMPFLGIVTERAFRKRIQSTESYTN